jgi:hypothetical protein
MQLEPVRDYRTGVPPLLLRGAPRQLGQRVGDLLADAVQPARGPHVRRRDRHLARLDAVQRRLRNPNLASVTARRLLPFATRSRVSRRSTVRRTTRHQTVRPRSRDAEHPLSAEFGRPPTSGQCPHRCPGRALLPRRRYSAPVAGRSTFRRPTCRSGTARWRRSRPCEHAVERLAAGFAGCAGFHSGGGGAGRGR